MKLYDFTEFLITLTSNLKNCDMGYWLGDTVCESVITNIIHKWLKILYVTLKFLIRWPRGPKVSSRMFLWKFQRAMVIIDSTEVFIEQATNLLTRSQTWSNYKSHNTVKYLIGITQQGTISFASEAWKDVFQIK